MPICHNNGFTLIEVLIALVIIAIALIAIVKASAYDVEDTTAIQQKSIATWLASNMIAEAQLGLIAVPKKNQRCSMLRRDWFCSAILKRTADRPIDKIFVSVRRKPQDNPITTLWGFVNHE